jgi:hypothetical protein
MTTTLAAHLGIVGKIDGILASLIEMRGTLMNVDEPLNPINYINAKLRAMSPMIVGKHGRDVMPALMSSFTTIHVACAVAGRQVVALGISRCSDGDTVKVVVITTNSAGNTMTLVVGLDASLQSGVGDGVACDATLPPAARLTDDDIPETRKDIMMLITTDAWWPRLTGAKI